MNKNYFLEDVVVVKKIFVMVVDNGDQVCDNFEDWKMKVMRVFHRWCCWWCVSCRWGLCAWRHRYKMIGKHERQMMKMTKRGHPRSFLSLGSSSSIFAVAALVVIVGLDTCTIVKPESVQILWMKMSNWMTQYDIRLREKNVQSMDNWCCMML